jgi:hypothetical protein
MALDRLGTTAMVVGIAVLLEPMIRDAVRSAVARTKVDADGRTQPSPSPRQSRSRRANGGPPEATSPRPTGLWLGAALAILRKARSARVERQLGRTEPGATVGG